MEYMFIYDEKGLMGIACSTGVVVPCKYRFIKLINNTGLYLVEKTSGCVINGKYVSSKNVLDANNDFNPVFDEDFYYYDIVNYEVVPHKTDPVLHKKANNKPDQGYQF